MDWEKFNEESPKENVEVLILWRDNYYVAKYERRDSTFTFCNNNGANFCNSNDNVYWANLTVPDEVREEKEIYKNNK